MPPSTAFLTAVAAAAAVFSFGLKALQPPLHYLAVSVNEVLQNLVLTAVTTAAATTLFVG